jgi:hypothetical protein
MWFRGLDESERARMHDILKGSSTTFDRLRELIKGLYRTSHHDTTDMSSPNWALNMARHEGYKEALRDIHKLLPRPRGNT